MFILTSRSTDSTCTACGQNSQQIPVEVMSTRLCGREVTEVLHSNLVELDVVRPDGTCVSHTFNNTWGTGDMLGDGVHPRLADCISLTLSMRGRVASLICGARRRRSADGIVNEERAEHC